MSCATGPSGFPTSKEKVLRLNDLGYRHLNQKTGEQMLTADILLSGPRGRRMLLAYAIDAERALRPEPGDDMFRINAHRAAYHLDIGQGTSQVLFGPGAEEARQTIVTAEGVARSLTEISLPDVTAVDLRSALAEAVDAARYWQDPDGEDVLVATEVMRDELRRVAEHIAGSECARWWSTSLASSDQWSILSRGEESPDTDEVPAAQQLLSEWRTSTLESEARAERDRPVDPAANWSGYWWSNPPLRVRRGRCSTGLRRACGSSKTAWDGNGSSSEHCGHRLAHASTRSTARKPGRSCADGSRSRSPQKRGRFGIGLPADQAGGSSPTGCRSRKDLRECTLP